MIYQNLSQEYKVKEVLLERGEFKVENFLYTNLEQLNLKESLEIDDKNIDLNLALACHYYNKNALEKSLKLLNKCVYISNSYHCYFHYFGFNLGMKIWSKTGEDFYKKKAEFLYPNGGDISEEFLPAYKDVCIFRESTCFRLFFSERIDCLKTAFERSEEEHLTYHLLSADVFFLRGLIWRDLNKPEIAKVDFEKALKMESKNPKNDIILKEISKLRI